MCSVSIKNSIKALSFAKNSWKIELLRNWPDIVGNFYARVTLERIDDSFITIGVADSCLLQELYLLSPLICKLINEKLDLPRIKIVRFKKIGIAQKRKKKKVLHRTKQEKTVQLTPQEQAALTTICDEELQEYLKKFRARCLAEE